MKKLFAVALVATLVGAASTAFANNGAMDLSWNKCDVTAASTNKVYDCLGVSGNPVTMTGSFVMPFALNDFAGVSAVVDVQFAGPTPDYWKTLSGECDAGAITIANPSTAAPCGPSLFDPNFSGGGITLTYPTTSRIRLRIDWATGAPTPPSTAANVRYAGFAVSLDPDQGVNAGCAGCAQPGCIALESIEVFGFAAGEDYFIDTPDARNYVTWQGGQPGCPAVTPTQNKTLGSVKALYR